jgi:hypothetical protein
MISASVETLSTPTANPAFIRVPGNPTLLEQVRHRMLEAHEPVVDIDDPLIPESSLPAVARALQLAQVAALTAREDLNPATLEAIRNIAGDAMIDNEQQLEHWLRERP